jgi:hypothetical protein
MAEPTTAGTGTAQSAPITTARVVDTPQGAFPVHRSWKIAMIVAIGMVLLALLGVGLCTAEGGKSATASVYWMALVPVYAIMCIWTAWTRTGQGSIFSIPLVNRQIFHWLGIGVALGLDFMIRRTGEESGMGSGMVALLLLALGCYLAGIHFEWLFVLVGILLSLTLIMVAEAEQYLWLVFVVGLVAILAMLGLNRLTRGQTQSVSVGS